MGPWWQLCFIFHSGDLGGLMGLLMGLSAISIFEILDLIIYNSFRKIISSRKNKASDKQSKN